MSGIANHENCLNIHPKVAICISTRNRPSEFNICYQEWKKAVYSEHYNINLFVVDDASDKIYYEADYIFLVRSGIPRVKNKCIELAMDWGAEHIFLVDDDVYPKLGVDSIKPYIESKFNLLCYTFYKPIIQDSNHKFHLKGNGCMMYLNKVIIECIGGFDNEFKLGKYEHTQYFERAHSFGLTPATPGTPFIDIRDSHLLFHSMDEHHEVKRSFSNEEMTDLLNINKEHYYKTRFQTEFIPYK